VVVSSRVQVVLRGELMEMPRPDTEGGLYFVSNTPTHDWKDWKHDKLFDRAKDLVVIRESPISRYM